MNERLKTIVDTISDEIAAVSRSLRNEEHMPSRNADDMDAFIKECREQIKDLRQLRIEAESIFTGTKVS